MSVVDRVPISYRRVSNLAHAEQYVYGEGSRNAFEYYLERGSIDGFAVDDWLRAERSILIKPDVTLKRFNQDFFIEVLLPGACPEDILLDIATNAITTATCLYDDGRQFFRSIPLPEEIDVESVDAECVGDTLRITASIAASLE